MKFKNLFLLLFLTVIAISCKDEAKKEGNPEPAQEEKVSANAFKVSLTIVAKKDDDFCLLYTEDGSLNFKDGVWQHVKGSDMDQVVEFIIPDEAYPTELRFDLGKNPEQEDFVIKAVKFEYTGNVRELKGPEIAVFFRPDANKCTFDAATGVIKALVKDGKKESPSLYPHEAVMSVELPKLAKK